MGQWSDVLPVLLYLYSFLDLCSTIGNTDFVLDIVLIFVCLSDFVIERFFFLDDLYTLVFSNGFTCPAPSKYSKIPVHV